MDYHRPTPINNQQPCIRSVDCPGLCQISLDYFLREILLMDPHTSILARALQSIGIHSMQCLFMVTTNEWETIETKYPVAPLPLFVKNVLLSLPGFPCYLEFVLRRPTTARNCLEITIDDFLDYIVFPHTYSHAVHITYKEFFEYEEPSEALDREIKIETTQSSIFNSHTVLDNQHPTDSQLVNSNTAAVPPADLADVQSISMSSPSPDLSMGRVMDTLPPDLNIAETSSSDSKNKDVATDGTPSKILVFGKSPHLVTTLQHHAQRDSACNESKPKRRPRRRKHKVQKGPRWTGSKPKQKEIGMESEVDKSSNESIVTATSSSNAIINDPHTIQHGTAIATNNRLTHSGDEQFNSSTLQMEPLNQVDDSSAKSDDSCVTFMEPTTLDVTVDSTTKFRSPPESPKLDCIDRGSTELFDIDLSCINDNDTLELGNDETQSTAFTLEQVDVSKSIRQMFDIVRSTLDDAFDSFYNAFDSNTSNDLDSIDLSPPLNSSDHNLTDSSNIDLEVGSYVLPDILLELNTSGTTKPPPIAIVTPPPPSNPRSKSHWKLSEKDGERPHKPREKNGEHFESYSLPRPYLEADQSQTIVPPRNPSSTVKDWERLHRRATWLPKFDIQDKSY